MPFVEYPQQIVGIKIRKRLGLPNGCGWAMCGWSECGDDNEFTGVYQQRRNREWNGAGGFNMVSGPRNFYMAPAWPTFPGTEAQIEKNDNFATAVSMWQALTTEQKESYNQIAIKKNRKGYNYFLSLTLKSL